MKSLKSLLTVSLLLVCVMSFAQHQRIRPKTILKRSTTPLRAVFTLDTAIASILPRTTIANANEDVLCDGLSSLDGKPLRTIEAVMNQNGISLYFNDYFTNHPARSHFSPYFRSLNATPSPTTPFHHSSTTNVSNSSSVTDIFGNIDLYLAQIICSSKYGGSVKYVFKSKEDYGYELRTGNIVWDFQDFGIDVYSTPTFTAMNATNEYGVTTNSSLHLEFTYSAATPYDNTTTAPSGNVQLVNAATENQTLVAQKDAALSQLKTSLLPGLSALRLFTAGVIRALNAPLFNNNTIVDAVQITDGSIDLVTRTGVKVAKVSVKVLGIDVNTEAGGEEFFIDIYEGSGYGYEWRTIKSDKKLGQNESSGWYSLGSFTVTNNCPSKTYYMHYDLVERDDAPLVGGSTIFTSPDYFDVRPHNIIVNCSQLNNVPANQVVDEGQITGIEIHTENMVYDLRGTMSVAYKVVVGLR